MGMFDYLNCFHSKMPEQYRELTFQTKDLEDLLDTYEIREDGFLYEQKYDIVDRSDPNAVGISRMFGMLSRENIHFVKSNHTGEVSFYTNIEETDTWIEFSSYFINGELKYLIQVKPDIQQLNDMPTVTFIKGNPSECGEYLVTDGTDIGVDTYAEYVETLPGPWLKLRLPSDIGKPSDLPVSRRWIKYENARVIGYAPTKINEIQ